MSTTRNLVVQNLLKLILNQKLFALNWEKPLFNGLSLLDRLLFVITLLDTYRYSCRILSIIPILILLVRIVSGEIHFALVDM